MPTYRVQRSAPAPVAPGSRAGAAEIDITPPPGITMAGYSKEGKRGKGCYGHLFARALYLQDAQGEAVAFCTIDLLSGSRYLLEKVASLTAPACGISVDRLLLTGSHTHTAPGNYFGDSFYDIFAQLGSGFDVGFADWLSGKIAGAVIEAARGAVPARAGVAVVPLWGACRNRSYEAFWRNPEAADWHQAGLPGAGMPAGLEAREDAVDPRVTVLAAVRADDGRLIGAHGYFSCHATSLSNPPEFYSPDLSGVAARVAQEQLFQALGYVPPVGVANAAAGDISPMREDIAQGPNLMRFVGQKLGMSIAQAAQQAMQAAQPIALQVRFIDPPNCEETVNGDPSTALASRWVMGAPTLGGAEDARNYLLYPLFVQEGMVDTAGRFFPPRDPQHPKVPAFGDLQLDLLQELLRAAPMPVLPMHAVQVGSHLFACLPGEPTVTNSYRIETTLQAELPGVRATVLGYSGGYFGYFTTSEEYDAQHYEGSSVLLGANTARHLCARLAGLVQMPPPPVDYQRVIDFETVERNNKFIPGSGGASGDPERISVARKNLTLDLAWRTPRGLQIDFSEGPLVWLEEDAGGGNWRILSQHGRPFDDQHQEILIQREERIVTVVLREAIWRVQLTLPRLPSQGLPMRVVVAPRGGMSGFLRVIR